jgi:RNA polymerase sigma factor (sigma-70 family)
MKGLATRRVRMPTLLSVEHFHEDDDEYVEFLRCERRDPEEEVLVRSEVRRVREAIARLSPRDQGVLRRCYLEGLSLREYAAEIGKPLTTVDNWARWAKSNLRALLDPSVARREGERP